MTLLTSKESKRVTTIHTIPVDDLIDIRDAIADEQGRHQGLRGPMDDARPNVWQNRCICGWDDGDERPGWKERYRQHIADAIVAGPLAGFVATTS